MCYMFNTQLSLLRLKNTLKKLTLSVIHYQRLFVRLLKVYNKRSEYFKLVTAKKIFFHMKIYS